MMHELPFLLFMAAGGGSDMICLPHRPTLIALRGKMRAWWRHQRPYLAQRLSQACNDSFFVIPTTFFAKMPGAA